MINKTEKKLSPLFFFFIIFPSISIMWHISAIFLHFRREFNTYTRLGGFLVSAKNAKEDSASSPSPSLYHSLCVQVRCAGTLICWTAPVLSAFYRTTWTPSQSTQLRCAGQTLLNFRTPLLLLLQCGQQSGSGKGEGGMKERKGLVLWLFWRRAPPLPWHNYATRRRWWQQKARKMRCCDAAAK